MRTHRFADNLFSAETFLVLRTLPLDLHVDLNTPVTASRVFLGLVTQQSAAFAVFIGKRLFVQTVPVFVHSDIVNLASPSWDVHKIFFLNALIQR